MNRLTGWSGKFRKRVTARRCPGCGNAEVALGVDDEGKCLCPSCRKRFSLASWSVLQHRLQVATCGVCGEAVVLTMGTLDDAGLTICDNPQCRNIIAVRVSSRYLQPQALLSTKWSPALARRAQPLESSRFRVAEVVTSNERLIPLLLCRVAQGERTGFRCWSELGDDMLLLACSDASRYVGYVFSSFDDDGTAVLRHIFVDAAVRGQGLGTRLLRYWAETYALPRRKPFGVESPNGTTKHMLVKLGYARMDGTTMVGLVCDVFSVL
jgi:GNAT superfamily N-acetyltransferase